MRSVETVVVGGGPAGSTCAWALRRMGRDVLVLEASNFPRTKLCAGWVTPKVLTDLELDPNEVPSLEAIPAMNLHWKTSRPTLRIPSHQYSVQRSRFDAYLLERACAPVETHHVKQIDTVSDGFVIDKKYHARHLVGAGGTSCPVKRSLFSGIHREQDIALAKELEFRPVGAIVRETHLWWRFPVDPGFAWHVPKPDSINIGFGYWKTSKSLGIRAWDTFLDMLRLKGFLGPDDRPRPKGWSYYLLERRPRAGMEAEMQGRAMLIGDALGLATWDLGEGIGPAIESGKSCALRIAEGSAYRPQDVTRSSILGGRWIGRLCSPLY